MGHYPPQVRCVLGLISVALAIEDDFAMLILQRKKLAPFKWAICPTVDVYCKQVPLFRLA